MRWKPVAAILLRQVYLMKGSPARILPLFLWVAVDIVLWGFITKYLNSMTSGFNWVPAMLGAVLLWDFFNRVMMGVTMAFFEDVWSRNFLNFFTSPLSVRQYVTGLVLSGVITSTLGLIAMLVLASAWFGLSFFSFGLALVPFLLNLFVFGIALGIVACGIVLRMGPASEWLIWPIPTVLSPFAAVFYPLALLPVWMRAVAYALPPAYVFEGMRALLDGKPVPMGALAGATALSFFYLALACWFFAVIYRKAVRAGLIARYSAETVS